MNNVFETNEITFTTDLPFPKEMICQVYSNGSEWIFSPVRCKNIVDGKELGGVYLENFTFLFKEIKDNATLVSVPTDTFMDILFKAVIENNKEWWEETIAAAKEKENFKSKALDLLKVEIDLNNCSDKKRNFFKALPDFINCKIRVDKNGIYYYPINAKKLHHDTINSLTYPEYLIESDGSEEEDNIVLLPKEMLLDGIGEKFDENEIRPSYIFFHVIYIGSETINVDTLRNKTVLEKTEVYALIKLAFTLQMSIEDTLNQLRK